MTQPRIAAFAHRRTRVQRIALLMVFVVLADFGADDGCSCDPSDFTRTVAVSIGTHR